MAGRRDKINPLVRFWQKVSKSDSCWNWTGTILASGYGVFMVQAATESYKGIVERAHVFSYQLANGLVPKGLQLDHLCRNKLCVNPAHLEAVTSAENVRRAMKDHCKRGHPFDAKNTAIVGGTHRVCKTCQSARAKAFYARHGYYPDRRIRKYIGNYKYITVGYKPKEATK